MIRQNSVIGKKKTPEKDRSTIRSQTIASISNFFLGRALESHPYIVKDTALGQDDRGLLFVVRVTGVVVEGSGFLFTRFICQVPEPALGQHGRGLFFFVVRVAGVVVDGSGLLLLTWVISQSRIVACHIVEIIYNAVTSVVTDVVPEPALGQDDGGVFLFVVGGTGVVDRSGFQQLDEFAFLR